MSHPGDHSSCEHCQHHHELEVTDVSVRYGKVPALEKISFATSCGNVVALIGPNGAGKSTLLKSIAGLVPRQSGRVLWRGSNVSRWHKEFAYLPQREDVDWNFPVTVRGLVEMGRYSHTSWWRKFSKRDQDAVDAAMVAMQLEGLESRQISQLSGGQQQRAFLARALAQEAHVFLLDEPFTGLDRPAQENLVQLMRDQAREGRLIISSHHDLATVREMFDQVLVINRKTITFGAVAEVYHAATLEAAYGCAIPLPSNLLAPSPLLT
jgi:ABC-type Mn2+/Zn2+ transport system ATPase subunit